MHRAVFVATTLTLAACGGVTGAYGASPSDDAASGEGPSGNASPPVQPDQPADSNTLRVDAFVSLVPSLGASVDTTDVLVVVYVREAATGAPVTDATVTGGPAGHAVALAFDQPSTYSTTPHYGALLTGYAPSWELSVERGADHLRGVVFVGPSYPAIGFRAGTSTVTITWAPAVEANVSTSVCAWGSAIGPPGEGQLIHQGWCADGHDEGVAVLSPANLVQSSTPVPLPVPGALYYVELVEGLGNLPIGSQGGTATFALVVDSDATVTPRRCGFR